MTTQQKTAEPRSTVTVIGTGPMGVALSETLMKQGHALTVWNRTPEKADRLVAGGASRAATVAEAVSASRVTVACLADYEVTHEVLATAGDALRGRGLVNLASGTPGEARAAAVRANERGVAYVDGAIMVPPTLVGDSDAVLLYSGSREAFEEHRTVLASLGGPRHLGTDPGLAVLYNTALLEMMYALMNGWLHASALVGSANVSAVEFADLAFGWFMPTVANPEGFTEQAPDLDNANYPGDLGTLRMNLNALDHIVRTSQEQDIDSTQPEVMRQIAERGVADGHGADSYLSLFEIFRKPTRNS